MESRAPYTLTAVAKDDSSFIAERDRCAAQVGHVLARALRGGEVEGVVAPRTLGHKLHRRNRKQAPTIAMRVVEADIGLPKHGLDDARFVEAANEVFRWGSSQLDEREGGP